MTNINVLLGAALLVVITATSHLETEEVSERYLSQQDTESKIYHHPSANLANLDHASRVAMENPPFGKCFDALNTASTDKTKVTRTDYIEFLRLMSAGDMDKQEFKDLDLAYVSMFYLAACSYQSCQSQDGGSIGFATPASGEELSFMIALCFHVLSDMVTTSSFQFDVIVEFDPTTVSQFEIGGCLESAAQRNLWDGFGCEMPNVRRLSNRDRSNHKFIDVFVSKSDGPDRSLHQASGSKRKILNRQGHAVSRFGNRPIIPNQSVGAPSPQPGMRRLDNLDESCEFSVTARVVSSTFINCPWPKQNLLCGIVLLNATVMASQLYAPHEDDLRNQAAQILYQSVTGDTFEDFFPPGCT
ncbi:hypothetical protein ACA910_017080 [Epithemia clementina (nom. ined.)]